MTDPTRQLTASVASVTSWLVALRDGESAAAELLWEFLKRRLLTFASGQIRRVSPVYDEDDVALSAFHTLCDGVQKGRYSDLSNRDELWRLLAVITMNKARKRAAHETRQRRGGTSSPQDLNSVSHELVSPEASPEIVAVVQEECHRLLERLPQPELKVVAMLKVEGYTNDEVAAAMDCSRRSVQRRLNLIRDIWSDETGEE